MKNKMELPQNVVWIIDRLNMRGYRADVVGGAVRDMYIGRVAPDFDIATNARPSEVKDIFSDVRTIDTGIKHGTVTVHLDGENYEVTTYRLDGAYKDARHPESVEFTDELALDLSRRDFTMNAMAYNKREGIIDLFGGISDIESRIIRTVGDGSVRFSEDALRILRALRFASVLDFEIEDSTRKAIFEKAHLLSLVSVERIYAEWNKLISGVGAYRVLSDYKPIFENILLVSLENMPNRERFCASSNLSRMLSIFAMGSERPCEVFDSTMRRLHTDNNTRILGTSALKALAEYSLSDISDVLFALSVFGTEVINLAIEVGIIIGKYTQDTRIHLTAALSSGVPYKISDLAIGGINLLAVGLHGEMLGRTLQDLLIKVIKGECENTKDSLLSVVAKH